MIKKFAKGEKYEPPEFEMISTQELLDQGVLLSTRYGLIAAYEARSLRMKVASLRDMSDSLRQHQLVEEILSLVQNHEKCGDLVAAFGTIIETMMTAAIQHLERLETPDEPDVPPEESLRQFRDDQLAALKKAAAELEEHFGLTRLEWAFDGNIY